MLNDQVDQQDILHRERERERERERARGKKVCEYRQTIQVNRYTMTLVVRLVEYECVLVRRTRHTDFISQRSSLPN